MVEWWRVRAGAAALIFSMTMGWCPRPDEPVRLTPVASVETEPAPHEGDSIDDPAIWVHPTEPAKSLVLGTDKKGGLLIFDLQGTLKQVVSDGARPNNVDILAGFAMGGRPRDLAVAGVRAKNGFGVAFWTIDAETRTLAECGPLPAFPVFGGTEPYGSCVYHSRRDGSYYVIVTNKAGDVEQYRLEAGSDGSIRGTRVRAFSVGSQAEGCVADDELGRLYIAEENVGIWAYGAEPDSGVERRCVARVAEHGLTADMEGLTLYRAREGKGYLIASVQGNSTFAVFERGGDNRFVATIDPAPGMLSDVGQTDGIDVTNQALGPKFPSGLFVVQDGIARNGRQHFKYFSWADVGGAVLQIDTAPTDQ